MSEEDIAIENALNRLAELEKENAELKEMLQNKIKYTQELEQDLFENASNYVVPKAKVKEKLEKYKNKLSLISEVCVDESKLHIESSQAIEEIRKILGE